jgi:hypothetical protein
MPAAHDASTSHRYTVHYPEHGPRPSDPHYKDFEAYKKKYKSTAKCYVGERAGISSCAGGLELHHSHIEFSLTNGVNFEALEKDYPGISTDQVGQWIESDPNLRWLCTFHHRGHGGAHVATHSDWESQLYVTGLLSLEEPYSPPTHLMG